MTAGESTLFAGYSVSQLTVGRGVEFVMSALLAFDLNVAHQIHSMNNISKTAVRFGEKTVPWTPFTYTIAKR